MFSSTGPGRHGWHGNRTCFDLGQQSTTSAFLWGLSVRVFPCRAVVARVRVSDSQVLYEPVIFGSFFFWRLPGDFWRSPLRPAWFFLFGCPWQRGGWPAARVSKSSARFGSPWFLFYRLAFSVAGAFYYSCTMPMALVVWCCCGSGGRCFPTTTTTTTTNPPLSSSGPTGAGMGLYCTTVCKYMMTWWPHAAQQWGSPVRAVRCDRSDIDALGEAASFSLL